MAKQHRNHLLWIGPLVAFVGVVSYFQVFARYPALRDTPWLNAPVIAAGVVLSIVAVARAYRDPGRWRGRVVGVVGLAFSALFAGLFFWYILSYSSTAPAPAAGTLAMETAPDFTLPDRDGAPVSLADQRGRKAVVVFYRGFW